MSSPLQPPPTLESSSGHSLVDLLDRILERGLVINADIIISLAGVPLIAINLRAALAGVETLLQYTGCPAAEDSLSLNSGNQSLEEDDKSHRH